MRFFLTSTFKSGVESVSAPYLARVFTSRSTNWPSYDRDNADQAFLEPVAAPPIAAQPQVAEPVTANLATTTEQPKRELGDEEEVEKSSFLATYLKYKLIFGRDLVEDGLMLGYFAVGYFFYPASLLEDAIRHKIAIKKMKERNVNNNHSSSNEENSFNDLGDDLGDDAAELDLAGESDAEGDDGGE